MSHVSKLESTKLIPIIVNYVNDDTEGPSMNIERLNSAVTAVAERMLCRREHRPFCLQEPRSSCRASSRIRLMMAPLHAAAGEAGVGVAGQSCTGTACWTVGIGRSFSIPLKCAIMCGR